MTHCNNENQFIQYNEDKEDSDPNIIEYNDDKEESEDEKKNENGPLLLTDTNEVVIQCVNGCNEILKYCKYNQLSKTIYQIEGLPKTLKCYDFEECGNILTKEMLCFYCPIGVVKASKHFGMVWCNICIMKKAKTLYFKKAA